jgi:hypothetical protein
MRSGQGPHERGQQLPGESGRPFAVLPQMAEAGARDRENRGAVGAIGRRAGQHGGGNGHDTLGLGVAEENTLLSSVPILKARVVPKAASESEMAGSNGKCQENLAIRL